MRDVRNLRFVLGSRRLPVIRWIICADPRTLRNVLHTIGTPEFLLGAWTFSVNQTQTSVSGVIQWFIP